MSIPAERSKWWSAKRGAYNLTLIIAAPISFVLLLVIWGLFEERLPCLEIAGPALIVAPVLFLIGLGLANLCYLLGPLSERIVRPRNPVVFRRWIFGLGVAFSVLLVFEPPIATLATALTATYCIDEFGNRIEIPRARGS